MRKRKIHDPASSMTRRELLRRLAATGVAALVSPRLAACDAGWDDDGPAGAPRLPQREDDAGRMRRESELTAAREEYAVAARLGELAKVARLPISERFSDTYNGLRLRTLGLIDANATQYRERGPVALARLADYAAFFASLPLPDVASDPTSDRLFAGQRQFGFNTLDVVDARTLDADVPALFSLDDPTYARVLSPALTPGATPPGGVASTLSKALDRGRLFACDHRRLAGLTPKPDRHQPAPIALFFADAAVPGGLTPVAIWLGEAARGLVCTPLDGPDWQLAKMLFQSADGLDYILRSHLSGTHLALEALALAMHRELATTHPLHVLLAPHFRFTMAINKDGEEVLLGEGGVFDRIISATSDSVGRFVASSTRDALIRWTPSSFPRDLEQRGVGADSALSDYPLRDDGLDVWHALRHYVSGYLDVYYRDDGDVANDTELQRMLAAMSRPLADGGVGVTGFAERVTTKIELTDLLTQTIFTAGPMHSRSMAAFYDFGAFAPNLPLAIHRALPTERGVRAEELTSWLPDAEEALDQLFLTSIVSHPFDPHRLGDLGDLAPRDPRVLRILGALQRELLHIEDVIAARNAARPHPFEGFLPSRMNNSTSV